MKALCPRDALAALNLGCCNSNSTVSKCGYNIVHFDLTLGQFVYSVKKLCDILMSPICCFNSFSAHL